MSATERIDVEVLELVHAAAKQRTASQLAALLGAQTAALRAHRSDDAVELTTIHGAKGREWDHVILYGADEGQLPHAHSMADTEGGIEDERRLCYVALTRARGRDSTLSARRGGRADSSGRRGWIESAGFQQDFDLSSRLRSNAAPAPLLLAAMDDPTGAGISTSKTTPAFEWLEPITGESGAGLHFDGDQVRSAIDDRSRFPVQLDLARKIARDDQRGWRRPSATRCRPRSRRAARASGVRRVDRRSGSPGARPRVPSRGSRAWET